MWDDYTVLKRWCPFHVAVCSCVNGVGSLHRYFQLVGAEGCGVFSFFLVGMGVTAFLNVKEHFTYRCPFVGEAAASVECRVRLLGHMVKSLLPDRP